MQAPDPNMKLEVIFETADPVELGLAQAALQEAGIEFAVTEEALLGYGFSPMLNPPSKILVAEDLAQEAREALEGLPDEASPIPEEDEDAPAEE